MDHRAASLSRGRVPPRWETLRPHTHPQARPRYLEHLRLTSSSDQGTGQGTGLTPLSKLSPLQSPIKVFSAFFLFLNQSPQPHRREDLSPPRLPKGARRSLPPSPSQRGRREGGKVPPPPPSPSPRRPLRAPLT